jgi:formiminoglutamase
MNVLDATKRPDQSLFYSRNDLGDRRMGDLVSPDPADYRTARFVILGCPQDEGVRRNSGRTGASEAPAEIRRALYKLPATNDIDSHGVFDIGDVKNGDDLEETHQRQYAVVKCLLEDQKNVIVFGGGNDISYPDASALADTSHALLAFNIDSHFDVREDSPRNSGTAYRQLLEEGKLKPQRFYQMANKLMTNSAAHIDYLRDKGVNVYSLDTLRRHDLQTLFDRILGSSDADAIFWGFDMDAVRTSDAPGVSKSYPIGLTAEEISGIAAVAGRDKRSRILEISEVNPRFDADQRTVNLAGMMIMRFLRAWSERGAQGHVT